jgi:hypothetical protein
MKSLDEEITDIDRLDELRRQARVLQQEAIEALTGKSYVPRPRRGSKAQIEKFERDAARPKWELPGDEVEKAEMLRALTMGKPKTEAGLKNWGASRKALITDLTSINYKDLIDQENALDDVPVFRCAVILHALAETPNYPLCKTALVCFYRIIQELYQVTAPAWTSGAARADQDAQVTAFTTGECVRALLALEKALLQTAQAAESLGKEVARETKFSVDLEIWRKQEQRMRETSLEISLAELPCLIVEIPSGPKLKPLDLLNKIAKTLTAIPAVTALDLPPPKQSSGAEAVGGADTFVPTHFEEAAKRIAWNAINQLCAALEMGPPETDPESNGKKIANRLRSAGQIVRDLLRPVAQFAESAIDRQIAAESQHLSVLVDAAELVFAANLLGLVSDWSRPKVGAAFKVLQPLLSSNGRLLSIRPFDFREKGYRLNVATLEVTRRLADLMANLDVELEPEFVQRLMLPLGYTRTSGERTSERGWMTDPEPREPNSLWWLTTIALDALGSIIRMLDQTINNRLLQRHFQVRKPESLKLRLDDLFYPDYGTAAAGKQDSVAVLLQHLRANAGHGPPEPKPAYSLILYGPPGTGKTTLVEAIAKTAGVPLVEITPSDILVGGAEGVERRARQVFQALAKLTHAVILFDEFDSILLDRARLDPKEIPTSVIEFLTPGMLPKLKTLNDACKEGRISYVLATNFVERLDPAVTRGGRFDEKCGIYPPDPISRLGRLLDQSKKFAALRPSKKIDFDEIRPRLVAAVKDTRGGPMDKLGRPGWYSMPRDPANIRGTLFGYILDSDVKPKPVTPEAGYEDEKKKYDSQRDKKPGEPDGQYWTDWKKIEEWEEKFKKSVADMPPWNQVYGVIESMVS